MCPIGQNGDLLLRILISDSDSRGDSVEVSTDVVVGTSLWELPLLPFPECLFKHVETVGVHVESIIGIEIVKEVPVNDNILSSLVLRKNMIKVLVHGALHLDLFVIVDVHNWNLIQVEFVRNEVRELVELKGECGSLSVLETSLFVVVINDVKHA